MKSFFTLMAGLLLLASTLVTTLLAQETITRYFGIGLPTFLAVYDTDGDNTISAAEQLDMEESRNGLPQERVLEFDNDADGVLSAQEAVLARAQLDEHVFSVRTENFNFADINEDGILDYSEFTTIDSIEDLLLFDSEGITNIFNLMQDPFGIVTLDSFIYAVEGSESVMPTTDVVVEYPDLPDLFGDDLISESLPIADPTAFAPDSIFNLPLNGVTDLTPGNPLEDLLANPIPGLLDENPVGRIIGINPLPGLVDANPDLVAENPLPSLFDGNPLPGLLNGNPPDLVDGSPGSDLLNGTPQVPDLEEFPDLNDLFQLSSP